MMVISIIPVLLAAFAAGVVGSVFGLGGGIIIVPALTLIFGVEMKQAVATSLFCVIATSVAATARYTKSSLANIKLGLILESLTAIGAILGSTFAVASPKRMLQVMFSLLMFYTAHAMWRSSLTKPADATQNTLGSVEPLDTKVGVRTSSYPNIVLGLIASFAAGILSSMLGVGGGVIKVPVMNLKMGLPLKRATATSSFMIGITATASIAAYYRAGYVNFPLVALCSTGVICGATIGPWMSMHLPTRQLRYGFIILLVFTAIQMGIKTVA